MTSCSELGFWSMPILTGFKVSLAPQQTLKDRNSEQIGGNSLLRNTVRYLQSAVSISNSLSLITSSRGCFCSAPVCLGAQQSSLAQWAVNMSASCVEGTSEVNELRLDNKSCKDISFYTAHLVGTHERVAPKHPCSWWCQCGLQPGYLQGQAKGWALQLSQMQTPTYLWRWTAELG